MYLINKQSLSGKSLSRLASLERSRKEQEDAMNSINNKLTQAIEVGSSNADATRRVETIMVQLMKGLNLPLEGIFESHSRSVEVDENADALERNISKPKKDSSSNANEVGVPDGVEGEGRVHSGSDLHNVIKETVLDNNLKPRCRNALDDNTSEEVQAPSAPILQRESEVRGGSDAEDMRRSTRATSPVSVAAIIRHKSVENTSIKTRSGFKGNKRNVKSTPTPKEFAEPKKQGGRKRKNGVVVSTDDEKDNAEVSEEIINRVSPDPGTPQKSSVLLVLNIQGTLLDVAPLTEDYQHKNAYKPFRTSNRSYVFRPSMDEFLQHCFSRFTVAFWGSDDEDYMREVCGILSRQCSLKELWKSNFIVAGPIAEGCCASDCSIRSKALQRKFLVENAKKSNGHSKSNTIYILPHVRHGNISKNMSNIIWSTAFDARNVKDMTEDNDYLMTKLWPSLEHIANSFERTETSLANLVAMVQSSLQVCRGSAK